jgi:protein-L-isoaspartate(D-aspartate) O-methyltransferase
MAAQNLLDPLQELRMEMVRNQLLRRGIRDARVVNAMERIPRHDFVAAEYRPQAYEDRPLPIGEEQTISQPYIVAVTLVALGLQGNETVLEVGTGSGYQTAILAELAQRVYSVERHETLARGAEQVLHDLGYGNVAIKVGDGTQGWQDKAPFDAIVVAAAAPRIPDPLFEQLRERGRMVIPVGPSDAQDLQLVRKYQDKPQVLSLSSCRFVPLIGEQGYKSSA